MRKIGVGRNRTDSGFLVKAEMSFRSKPASFDLNELASLVGISFLRLAKLFGWWQTSALACRGDVTAILP